MKTLCIMNKGGWKAVGSLELEQDRGLGGVGVEGFAFFWRTNGWKLLGVCILTTQITKDER